MYFCSFASGSDGNCYYVGTSQGGVLVDAGIGARTLKKRLRDSNIPLSSVLALFVTHDHFDHVASAGVVGEVMHIPVYSTEAILEGVNRCYKVTQKLQMSRRVQPVGTAVQVAGLTIESFPISHDATECVGYYITDGSTSLVIATDVGCLDSTVVSYLLKSNNLVLEANYDEEMLLQGPYPLYLKKRILSSTGHLANHVAVRFLCENYQQHWQRVFFCHLSKTNNDSEKLAALYAKSFDEKGLDAMHRPQCVVLPRTKAIEMYIL